MLIKSNHTQARCKKLKKKNKQICVLSTVVAHDIDIRRSFAAVDQHPETVDGAVFDGHVKARLTTSIGGVRRRSCLEQTPHDVATVRHDAQV